MKEKHIQSDLKRIDATTDEEIDYSDIPELDDEFFKNAKIVTLGGLSKPKTLPQSS